MVTRCVGAVVALALPLTLLVSCQESPDPCVMQEGAAATLCPRDQAGEALAADRLVWYHPVDSAEYAGDNPMMCGNNQCTVWVLPEDLVGTVFVAGWYYGPPHYEAGCSFTDYQTVQLELVAGSPQLVELDFDTSAEVCE